jgi:hypothetical protein
MMEVEQVLVERVWTRKAARDLYSASPTQPHGINIRPLRLNGKCVAAAEGCSGGLRAAAALPLWLPPLHGAANGRRAGQAGRSGLGWVGSLSRASQILAGLTGRVARWLID